ncbi:hypothetical protein HPB51_018046 [Rhipicephalus microplus]|uniref:Peptidase M13 N-terminal domain-containing protein n=1 Tax=Rhipicephalus microplus TaxID=6941 RepID=A0A9J6DP75_RHIMP|nr:hypothetical protein HPB51_018046 [Rhipicephalus microplus]
MPRLEGSSSSIVGVVDYINRITAKETKMAATAEGFTSTEQSAYKVDEDRAAMILFWLTGIASVGVVGMACVMMANPSAGGGDERPHVSPLLATKAWHGGSVFGNPKSGMPDAAVLPASLFIKGRRRGAAAMARQEFKGFNYPVCYTPSCVLLGKRLRAMLNPLVDPCDNFNEHVCGRYEGASFSILEDYDGILQAVREL